MSHMQCLSYAMSHPMSHIQYLSYALSHMQCHICNVSHICIGLISSIGLSSHHSNFLAAGYSALLILIRSDNLLLSDH